MFLQLLLKFKNAMVAPCDFTLQFAKTLQSISSASLKFFDSFVPALSEVADAIVQLQQLPPKGNSSLISVMHPPDDLVVVDPVRRNRLKRSVVQPIFARVDRRVGCPSALEPSRVINNKR